MAGLYFHIPYCRKVCSYCNFHFSTNTSGMNALLDAMELELKNAQHFLLASPLQSIYFGGGTPSLIPAIRIQQFLKLAAIYFSIEKDAEITLEANPEDITLSNVKAWIQAGINRISIGIQSLDAEDLKHMHRNHNAQQAIDSVALALGAGFPSVNVDLIFGSPWLSDAAWQKNLDWALGCGADHLSAYALTVEPKTFLHKKTSKGEWPGTDETKQTAHYKMLTEAADKEGWDFYEISNLSKPGHRAVHNSNYWKNLPYLGIGPSAHSFAGSTRRWNVADNKKYTENMTAGITIHESEILSAADKCNEYLLTNLRTVEGVNMAHWASFGVKSITKMTTEAEDFTTRGLVAIQNGNIKLTFEGRMLADWITAEWMV